VPRWAPVGGTLDVAIVESSTGALRATVTRRELERLVRRDCVDHPAADCDCAILDRPEAVARYLPTTASCAPATAPAGTRGAAARRHGLISTTSSRTAAVVPPTARTSAASAAGTTG
jgi:hypothetical protein